MSSGTTPPGKAATAVVGRVVSPKAIRSVGSPARSGARPRVSAAAITRGLVPLRSGEADRQHYVDRTRPTTAVAAYPGGIVPDDVP